MKVRLMTAKTKEYGAVSLFIVIFTTLLVTIITVGFVRIMLSDQRQATAADLSQSAYDSAQAGVEDAKRALLDLQTVCLSSDTVGCATARGLVSSTDCNKSVSRIVGYTPGQKEVLVQQTSGDGSAALQQAYTCVKITPQTDDYLGTLSQDESKVVPLVGVSNFDSVKLEWFSAKDLQPGTGTVVNRPPVASGVVPLLEQASWTSSTSPNRPSIMRAQLMQFGTNGFSLSDFDGSTNTGNISDANTLFLYPSAIASSFSLKNFADNARKTATSSPTQTSCVDSLSAAVYACSATITLPTPVGGGSSRTAFLRLTALYKEKTHYRLTLLSGGSNVKFDGVQPQIDSTGRANDLFRRVQSRVEMVDTDFPYPEAAVDVTGNFCKDFTITNDPIDHVTRCNP